MGNASGDRDLAAGRRARIGAAIVLVLATVSGGRALAQTLVPPDDDLCAARAGLCKLPRVAVITAFPGEVVPVLARTNVWERFTHEGRNYYVGRLAKTRVVVVRGGIGLLNAEATARYLVQRYRLATIVFSGVAGSPYDIGDVVVPERWTDGEQVYPVDPKLFALAQKVAATDLPLVGHTPIPPCPPGPDVSLDRIPRLIVGGDGESSDPYGDTPAPCAGDSLVLGCGEQACALPFKDGPVCGRAPAAPVERAAGATQVVAQDMETAAVAKVAAEAGIPFLGFRGVSDGGGDPCNLPGFPVQFFAYYQLAADNSATATIAVLAERAPRPDGVAPKPNEAIGDPDLAVRASCDWERAAEPTCAGAQAPPGVTERVARACALTAHANEPGLPAEDAARASERARRSWSRAAALVRSSDAGLSASCRRGLITALQQRAGTP
jgi:nucleoside phosphorylase